MDQLWQEINREIDTRGQAFVNQSRTAMGDVSSFINAIDWSEQWIQALLAFHVLLLVIVLSTRKYTTFQFILLFTIVITGGLTEKLNAFLGAHWSTFSRVNYFDQHGMFISIMFAGPLVLICLVILVNVLAALFEMLVKVKRSQIRAQAAQREKKKNQ